MFRRVVNAPVTVVLVPVHAARGAANMRFSTVLAIATGTAAAFTAARRLLGNENAVDELPEGLQEPAARAQGFLQQSRSNLTDAMRDAREEEASAEIELRQEYLRKVGRLKE